MDISTSRSCIWTLALVGAVYAVPIPHKLLHFGGLKLSKPVDLDLHKRVKYTPHVRLLHM